MNLLNLAGFFTNIWMDLWISLNAMVYQFIEWLYEIFEAIANVNLFSKDAFNDITKRLYIVIGIAMLFIFAYNIILMIIDPDNKKNMGNTGKAVKETIIALVLVILLPTIFNFMSIFQKNLLDSHVLEQIILGSTAGTGVECDFSNISVINNYVKLSGGDATTDMENKCNDYKSKTASVQGAYLVAPTIFTAFFHPKEYGYDECVTYLSECTANSGACASSSDGKITTDDDKELCAYYVYDTNIGQFTGGIMNFTTDDRIYADAWGEKGIFDFNYLMCFIAGCLAVYMFICYSLAIGVRVAKLGFLQIISPIPVMLRIIPKQKEAVYDKWFKNLLNTYLDVFIRLAIIYFCLFGISLVPDVMDSLVTSLSGNWAMKSLACVVVILGILQFAQEAPKLLQEFFGGLGGGGSFSLKSPAKQLSENKYAKGVLGAGGALAATTGKSIVGMKNFGKQVKDDWNNASSFKDRAKVVGRVAGSPLRNISEGITATRSGFKNAEDAKSWDDFREGTYRAAKEAKSQATLWQKTQGIYNAERDAMVEYYKGEYSPTNSDALLKSAEKLDKVAEALKALEDKLDSSDIVKGVKQSYDVIRRKIENGEAVTFKDKQGNDVVGNPSDYNDPEKLKDIMEKLQGAEKAKVGEARQKAYGKAKEDGDIGVLSLAEKYKEETRKNLDAINREIDAYNKRNPGVKDIEKISKDIDVENLMETKWKDARDPGKWAGDIASENRRIAFEQKKETGK